MDNKELTPLRPFKLWVLQNFPFIEEDFDALTNYEMMCKIVGKLNETIKLTNEQTSIIQNLSEEFTKLYDYVNQYLFDVDALQKAIEEINTRLDEIAVIINKNKEDIVALNSKIDNEINELNSSLTSLIDQNYNILKTYIDYNDNILNEKIDNIQIGQINIYDPTTGLLSPLQQVINNMYNIRLYLWGYI